MSNEGITERQSAFLASRQLAEAVEDLSAADINRMSMSDYAEIRRRVGLPDVDPFADAYASYEPPTQPASRPPAPAQSAPAPQRPGIDVANMDMDQYAQLRGQLGIDQGAYGRGIMNGSAGMDEWAAAARAKAGRTALSNTNTQQATRPDAGKYLDNGGQQVEGRRSWYSGQ